MSTTSPDWFLNDPDFAPIWEQVKPHTMTSPARGYALYQAVKHIVARPVAGNIIESGVWRGGSSMLIALTLMQLGETHRDLWLFDTFGGMPEPEPVDVDVYGKPAAQLLDEHEEEKDSSVIWAIADIDTVRENMASTGYPMERVHLVEGDVRETAAATRTGSVALLRLDTDWYSSTKAELEHFWHRLNQHGTMIVDDYGHWQGSQKAVDEFFDPERKGGPGAVLLQPIDYTGRLVVRSQVNDMLRWEERYDYRPPELRAPDLSHLFPTLVDTDPATCPDPRLRSIVPHIWRTDTREDRGTTGVISVEEASVLWATAHTRAGRRGLEIGSHYGWSTAHLLDAGLTVDAIDPAFGDRRHLSDVSGNLERWINAGSATLWPGFSPEIVPAVARSRNEPYGFAFIDGLHSDGGPARDVEAVLPHLAADAMVVFHDLTFPDVASAVRLLKQKGWKVRLYRTMQVMAAAWREGKPPPVYRGDPNHAYGLPQSVVDLVR